MIYLTSSSQQVSLIKDINSNGNANIGMITAFKDKLVFSTYSQATGVELWISDGTETGTQFSYDIYLGPISSGIVSPKVIN